MIKSELVDGFKGDGHVEVEQLGDINIGTYGPDDYVLETGKQLQAQVITNNKVRIFDGVMVIQGRRDVIAANAYTDVQIDNGAQGVKRNDIIVRKYTKDAASEIENTEFVVIKGTPGATATDPAVTVGNIRNGDTLHNMKLYRVRIEGLNIVGVDKLYKTNMSLAQLNSNLAFEAGTMSISGTPAGCTASVSGDYVRIGKMVFFQAEVRLNNSGTGTTEVSIPCLPYPTKRHSTFATGYQTCVIKTSAGNNYAVAKAGAYGSSRGLIFYTTQDGRTYTVKQNEIITSNTVILVGGSYIIAD